jgi:hypothetical protein
MKVFFANNGYGITMAGSSTGTYGILGDGSNVARSILFFDQKAEGAARQAKNAIKNLIDIQRVEYQRPPDQDIGIGTSRQEIWQVSGIDIEIVL